MASPAAALAAWSICALTCSAAAAAAEQPGIQWEFATGVDYTTGSYGNSVDTDMLYVPLTMRAKNTYFKFELTVPYLRLHGPGNVVGGEGPIIVGTSPGARTTTSGVGDTILGISYLMPRLGTVGPFVDLKAKVKAPTAADGLGTGKTDFSAQLNAYQLAGRRITLIAMLGYQVLGDPAGLELRNGVVGTLGVDVRTGRASSVGLLFDHHNRTFPGIDEQQSLAPYLSWRVAQRLGLTLYGVLGLTNSSPDHGAGLQFTCYPSQGRSAN